MQRIYTDSEFAAVLEAGHAIVFIGIAWSGQSTLSSSVIREWERTSNAWGIDCPVYNVMPDKLLSVARWMKDHAPELKGEGGYGSLIWLRSGSIVDFEPYVAGAGLREISRRTRAAFSRASAEPSTSVMWDRELDG